MYDVLDRADAQLEVGILGSCLRAPTTGAMEALRKVTVYLLGTKDACIKLRVQNGGSHLGGTGVLFRPRLGVAKVAEQWPCGHRRMPNGVMFTKAALRGTTRPARAPQGQKRRNHVVVS